MNTPLTENDLVQVATAILTRLSMKSIATINERTAAVWHEQLNGNANSQDNAAKKYNEAIARAVANLIPHDQQLIAAVIRGVAEK